VAGEDGVRLREAALVVGAALLASLIYTYPLLLHFGEAIPYGVAASTERRVQGLVAGDHLQFFYFLSLTDDMVHRRVRWFTDPFEFCAPHGSARRSFFFLPFSLLFALAAPLGRPAAYNLLVLLSFPATALAVHLLARRLGATPSGAAIAATALTLLPYRLANVAGGHPTGLAFFLLPLALYCIETAWQRSSRRSAAGAGLCFVCLALNEPHFLYFFIFLLPAWLGFAVWRLEPARRFAAGARAWLWLGVAAIGPTIAAAAGSARHRSTLWSGADLALLYALMLAIIAVAWRFSAGLRARGGESGDEASRIEARSYSPLALLALYALQLEINVPHLGIALVGVTFVWLLAWKAAFLRAAATVVWRERERLLALWPALAGLLVAGLLLLQYKSAFIDPSARGADRSLHEIRLFAPQPEDFLSRSTAVLTRQLYPGIAVGALAVAALAARAGRALWLVAAIFSVLALGPHAPAWLLLYAGASRFVPFFAIIRQPAKLFAVAAIALALCAAVGFDVLTRKRSTRHRVLLAGFAIGAILLDFSSVLPLGISRLPRSNRAYDVVAERARGSNILELPLWPGDSAFSSIYQYWATRTRVSMINGYSPTAPRDYVERVYRPLETANLGELDEAQNRLLDELGVRFVTLHRDTFPPQVSLYPYRFTLQAMRQNPNLRAVAEDDGVYLFERVGGAYRPWVNSAPWPMGVFYEAESLKLGAGERIDDAEASGGAAVRGHPGGDLPIVYGPYRPLPAGAYEARFRVRGRGRVEVSADRGTSALASASVDRPAWQEVAVAFATDHPRIVEFRAWPAESGNEVLGVDCVLLLKLDRPEDRRGHARRFEAEDLTALHGFDREADDVSGGAYAVIVDYPPGAVVRDGPYRPYPAGRWQVTVRSRKGPLRLRVETPDRRRLLLDVEVPARLDWTESDFELVLDAPALLCTRLVSAGREADVDYVEISAARSESASPAVEARVAADVVARR